MWFFSRKPKVVKEVGDRVWGFFVGQGFDMDTLSKDVRSVEKKDETEGGTPVTRLRYFRLSEAAKHNVEVEGWETFDRHPHLVLYEGYLNDQSNQIHLEKKRA